MPLEAAVELELEQRLLHFRGRRMTLPDQFVNQQRLGPERARLVCQGRRLQTDG